MSKWKVYISSTFKDLKEYRSQLIDLFQNQLENKFELTKVMEWMYDHGTFTPFAEDCVAAVKASDIYIVILGNKVGTFPPGDERTYTQVELQTAIENKKYIFCFRLQKFDENEIDNKLKHDEILATFAGKPTTSFKDGKDLEAAIYRALYQFASQSPINLNNPYKGLAAFDVEDGNYFYGRSTEIQDCLKKIVTGGNTVLISVIGNSGIGKTSFVQAGILYSLKNTKDLGFSDYKQVIVSPGSEPFTNLKYQLQLQGIAIDTIDSDNFSLNKTIIFFNQFEEVITQCHSENSMKEVTSLFQFLDRLVPGRSSDSKQVIITTFRSDFISDLANFRFIKNRQYFFPLNSLDYKIRTSYWEESLKEIIIKPALQNNVAVEDELVSRLINEIKEVDGSLPMLQLALQQTWNSESIQDRIITSSEYDKISKGKGISGIIEVHAEKVVDKILEGGDAVQLEKMLKSIFINLVEVSENLADIKRTITKTDLFRKLKSYPDEIVNEVIETLVSEKSRLLVVTQSKDKTIKVDIIHEVLIRKWERLRNWINERREALLFQESILVAIMDWKKSNYDPEQLYSQKRCEAAETWLTNNEDLANEDIKKFIEWSRRKPAFIYKEELLKDIISWKADKRKIYKEDHLKKLKQWSEENPDLLSAGISEFIGHNEQRGKIIKRRVAIAVVAVLMFTSGLSWYYYVQKQKKDYQDLCFDSPEMKDWRKNNPGLILSRQKSVTINDNQNLRYLRCFDSLVDLRILTPHIETALKTIQNLSRLESLNLEGDSIISGLSEIRQFQKLSRLDLKANVIDFTGIESLEDLADLRISGADSLKNFTEVAGLKKLRILKINYLRTKYLFPVISKCAQLEMLSVGDVRYIDFHGIEHLNKLRYLYIENVARLDNLQELKNLPSLDTLIINAPIDLHSFSLLNLSKNLKYLALADTSIKSLSGIEQFPFLTTLNLSAYHLRDLGNLEKLTGLKTLTVESKGISNSELKKISRLPLSVLYVYRPESLDFLDSLVNLETLVMELPSEMRDVTIQNNIRLKKLNLTCTYKTHNIKIRKSIKNLHEITLNGFYGIVEFEDPENFHIDSLSIIEAHNESNIFGEIEKLKLLKCLYLKSLRDFSFIRSLTQITKLSIVSPFASLDPNIFKDLHNLKELDLVYRVPASELEKIRKTLPNCKVSAEEIIKGE